MRSFARKHGVLKFLTLFAFVMATCVIAVAKNGDERAEKKEVLTPLEQRMLKRISVDFRNTPIDDVIRIMAEQADVDIIKSPRVVGNVTTTLTNVPLGEALDNILAAHGYGYVVSKNMIRIAPVEEITEKAERLTNRIYRIYYADVKETEKALKKFISKRGSLSCNPGTSNIIVTDTERKIKAIDTFIEEIDRITPQVLVEVRIYDVTSAESFELGVEWHAGRNVPITEIAREQNRKRTDSTTGPTDTWEQTTEIKDVVDTVDPTKTGTVTTVTTKTEQKPITTGFGITETDETTKTTEGTWWTDEDGKPLPYRRSKPFIGGKFDKDTGGVIRFGLLNDIIDLEIALHILHKQTGAKLLANPRLLVLDNETAEFKIVREVPYKEESEYGAGGRTTTTKFKDVGVELKVTPHVARDDMLRLHIMPEFSVLVDQVRDPETFELLVPTVDTRKIDTIALIRDGQTVVLGGLRQMETTQDIRKVPLLGDLPLVGQLFKDESESVKTTELLIFITPRIITEPTLLPTEQRRFEDTEIPSPKSPPTRLEKTAG